MPSAALILVLESAFSQPPTPSTTLIPEGLAQLSFGNCRHRAAVATVRERHGGRGESSPQRGERLLHRGILVDGRDCVVDDPERPDYLEAIVKRGYYAALLHKLLIVIIHDYDQPVAEFRSTFHHANMANVQWIKVTTDNTNPQRCGGCRRYTFTLVMIHG
jgi:hypothetical protein